MAQQPNNTLTSGQRAKLKNREKAERRFRAQMDAYLESQGLLNYQTGGTTQAQLQAAGVPVYNPQGGNNIAATPAQSQYTVKDNDTIASIASVTGAQPEDVLNANPDVNTIQTGMVLNVPRQTTANLTGANNAVGVTQNVGGLPSNAALGATTNNPQGLGGGLGGGVNASTPTGFDRAMKPSRGVQNIFNSIANTWQQGNQPGSYRPVGGPNPQAAIYAQPAQALSGAPLNAPTQTQTNPTSPQRRTVSQPRGNFTTFIDNITSQVGPNGRMPTAFELKYLIEHGRVKPAQTPSSAYGGGFGGGGGGGGGGRGGVGTVRNSTGGYASREPAFSSGAGFRGLVNWRI